MNDPQVWTLIGVFAAVMLGGMTLMSTSTNRVIRAEVGRLEATVNGRMDAMESRLDAKIDKLTARIDALDAEVSNLARRMWEGGRP